MIDKVSARVDRKADVSALQHQTARVLHLEQALDQTLAHLEEVRSQLIDQQWLEDQLANTEEIANVQQQAITLLKTQLEANKTALVDREQLCQDLFEASALLNQSNVQGDVTSIVLSDPETSTDNITPRDPQTTPSSRLEVRFVQAQQQIQVLYQQLWEKSGTQPELDDGIDQPTLNELEQHIQLMESELLKALQGQGLLQQACHELEVDREDQQHRLLEVETLAMEMQEQILRQAQQEREHETAIQHWKDRFYETQHLLLSLKELLEQSSDPLPQTLLDLLNSLPSPTPSEQMQSLRRAVVTPKPARSRRDLPDFLQRRRGYRSDTP